MGNPGRPTEYTQGLAREILRRLAAGESLRAICRTESMPPESTVRGWATDNVDGFAALYARARDTGLDTMCDELLDICDDDAADFVEKRNDQGEVVGMVADHDHINRARLKIDTRKWILSKLAPKRYGDRLGVDHGVTNEFSDLMKEIASRGSALPVAR